MDFDDIFDDMFKIMGRNFRNMGVDPFGFNAVQPTNNPKPSKNAKKITSKSDPSMKSYSISYRFGTGMKEPEIKVSGDVNRETIKQFMAGVPKFDFPANLDGKYIDLLKPKLHGLDEQPEEVDAAAHPQENEKEVKEEIPVNGCDNSFCDVIDTKTGALITLEMPGVGKDDVQYEFHNQHVIIHAENGNRKYNHDIPLNFTPVENPIITANNRNHFR